MTSYIDGVGLHQFFESTVDGTERQVELRKYSQILTFPRYSSLRELFIDSLTLRDIVSISMTAVVKRDFVPED